MTAFALTAAALGAHLILSERIDERIEEMAREINAIRTGDDLHATNTSAPYHFDRFEAVGEKLLVTFNTFSQSPDCVVVAFPLDYLDQDWRQIEQSAKAVRDEQAAAQRDQEAADARARDLANLARLREKYPDA